MLTLMMLVGVMGLGGCVAGWQSPTTPWRAEIYAEKRPLGPQEVEAIRSIASRASDEFGLETVEDLSHLGSSETIFILYTDSEDIGTDILLFVASNREFAHIRVSGYTSRWQSSVMDYILESLSRRLPDRRVEVKGDDEFFS